MARFLALAGMAKKVFKTGAFNRSTIPPSSILPDSSKLHVRHPNETIVAPAHVQLSFTIP
jgi:hypothetical protein